MLFKSFTGNSICNKDQSSGHILQLLPTVLEITALHNLKYRNTEEDCWRCQGIRGNHLNLNLCAWRPTAWLMLPAVNPCGTSALSALRPGENLSLSDLKWQHIPSSCNRIIILVNVSWAVPKPLSRCYWISTFIGESPRLAWDAASLLHTKGTLYLPVLHAHVSYKTHLTVMHSWERIIYFNVFVFAHTHTFHNLWQVPNWATPPDANACKTKHLQLRTLTHTHTHRVVYAVREGTAIHSEGVTVPVLAVNHKQFFWLSIWRNIWKTSQWALRSGRWAGFIIIGRVAVIMEASQLCLTEWGCVRGWFSAGIQLGNFCFWCRWDWQPWAPKAPQYKEKTTHNCCNSREISSREHLPGSNREQKG